MSHQDSLYPAKKTISPGGDFTIRQFFLPIRLNGVEVWALLDTGAHISILPREIADEILTSGNHPEDDGVYPLANVIEVPYQSYELNFQILEHVKGTMPEMNLQPYTNDVSITANLRNVEFQVPKYTWPEIADRVDSDSLDINKGRLDYVILGLYGVLDQLVFSFVGGNSVSVSSIGPR